MFCLKFPLIIFIYYRLLTGLYFNGIESFLVLECFIQYLVMAFNVEIIGNWKFPLTITQVFYLYAKYTFKFSLLPLICDVK